VSAPSGLTGSGGRSPGHDESKESRQAVPGGFLSVVKGNFAKKLASSRLFKSYEATYSVA
jgi:hypothetical protein